MIQIAKLPPRLLANAIQSPSGDQAGWRETSGPGAMTRGSLPSARITHTSEVPSWRLVNAIQPPPGDQVGDVAASPRVSRFGASTAGTPIDQMSRERPRLAEYTSRLAPADHDGSRPFATSRVGL